MSGRSGFGRGRRAPAGSWPSWRTSQLANTWKVIPFGNTFADADPRLRADVNPNGAGNNGPWGGASEHIASIDAYCSTILAQSANDARIWTGPGGGHLDGRANHQCVANLMAESPLWALLSKPSGSLPGGAITYDDGNDANAVYLADGRIRGNHNYQNIIHIPGTTKMFMSVVCAMYSSTATGPNKSFYFDTETGAQSNAVDYTSLASVSASNSGENSGTCYDPTRNCVWHIRTTGSTKMVRLNLSDGTCAEYGTLNGWVGGSSRLEYIPGLDVILNLTNISGGSGYLIFDPVSGSWGPRVPAAITGSPSAGLYLGANPAGYGGGRWVDKLGGVAVWNNDTNTTEISLLKPTGPYAWSWSVVPVSGSNTVTPPARIGSPGGVGSGLSNPLRRFDYSPALDGFIWWRSSSDQMYFFALS